MLKKGREKSLLRRHPWVFTGAIERIEGSPGMGETVPVMSSRGECLGIGGYSPKSQIAVRIWSFDPAVRIDAAFFRSRLEGAVAERQPLMDSETLPACRLVNAESDGIPGLIVDRYGDYLVCQFLTAGAERWKETIVSELARLLPVRGVYERSDAEVRKKEGLPLAAGLLKGEEPPELVEITEAGRRFYVDIRRGHKTGFYLDQRESRSALACAAGGAEVLNCFAYTGGFGIAALQGGAAMVTNIEASAAALDLAGRNVSLNGLPEERWACVEGDVFALLRKYRDEGRQFDIVVLDPPKFADSMKQLHGACRGYKDINLLAFRLLRPGGLLFTFSCSGLVPAELFQKIVADAALDAGCDATIIDRLGQSPDHPTLLSFPEGTYLKGLVCRVR